MATAPLKSFLVPALVIIAGFVLVVPLSGFIEGQRPAPPVGYEDSDLMIEGARFRGFALGMEGLIADWYWMRSLQYIGDKLLSRKAENINLDDLRDLNPRLLYPYLDNATDLDPHFMAAYTYGALVLPAIDPTKAIAIAEKGIRNNPDKWRLYQYLGYIHWKTGEYQKAADAYDRGAHIAGAAPFMKLMAAAMQTSGGDRETARRIFKQMLADESDPSLRLTADRRLKQLQWLDEQEAIDSVLTQMKDRGHCPQQLGEIRSALMDVRLPDGGEFHLDGQGRLVDPSGVPYLFDREQCRVLLDEKRTEIPIK